MSWVCFILFLSPPRRLVESREMPKVTTELLERVESAPKQLLGKQLPAFLWASETHPVLQQKIYPCSTWSLRFSLIPRTNKAHLPKHRKKAATHWRGTCTFFLHFSHGINKLILSATLLRQPKAETERLYPFKYVLPFFFFNSINSFISYTITHDCRCPSYTKQSTGSLAHILWCLWERLKHNNH